jgi:membrane-associated phospholipid phosphatase
MVMKKSIIKKMFTLEKKPHKGLFSVEWVILCYLIFTLLLLFFVSTKVHNPEAMLWGRIRVAVTMFALWGVYRMIPCRFTRFARIAAQLCFLGFWYSDTYEYNRLFPNLDHVFAQVEQTYFGCQPALIFSQLFPSHIISELMDMGYASYFLMIATITLYYFIWRYEKFEKVAFILLTSFFIYYVIFIFLPVAGPQYYYKAVGLDQIAHGVFPNIGDYFNNHQDVLASPGYTDGIFYHLVEDAKNAGERPTAAFPSSHVGISTILMIFAFKSNKKLWLFMLPFYLLLCMATVYIQAHYLIDAIAGFLSAFILYFVCKFIYEHIKH